MNNKLPEEMEFIKKSKSPLNMESSAVTWQDTVKEVVDTIKLKEAIILYGPPGTGKTRLVYDAVGILQQEGLLGKFEAVQFHHKFGYEDFMEGFVPNEAGGFSKRDGVFKEFIKNPSSEKKVDIFFIDEINRTDLTTTLGELLFLMDDRDVRKVKTSHFSEEIMLPKNTVIIGTMNTSDRNIAVVDFALRRRFRFMPVFTDYSLLLGIITARGFEDDEISADEFVKAARIVNERISNNRLMGKHMELGHSMWFPKGTGVIEKKDITDLYCYTIIPQLEAYCGYGYENQIRTLLNDNVANLYLSHSKIRYEDIKALIKDLYNKEK